MLIAFRLSLFAISLLTLFSCGSLIPTDRNAIDVSKMYRKDMIVTIDDKIYEGTGVLQDKETGSFKFRIETRGKQLDTFTLTTCAKELIAEKAWNVETKVPFLIFWSRKIVEKRMYEFLYSRNNLERALALCQIRLEATTMEDGKNSYAQFDIQDYRTTLPAWLNCNTTTEPLLGVGMCDHQQQKWIQLSFNETVLGTAIPDEEGKYNADCKLPDMFPNKDDPPKYFMEGQIFRFQVRPKKCIYRFESMKTGEFFRLTTFGWEDYIMRQ